MEKLEFKIISRNTPKEEIKKLEKQALATLIEEEEDSLVEQQIQSFNMEGQVAFGNVVFVIALYGDEIVCVCRYGILDDSKTDWIEWQVTTKEKYKGLGIAKLTIEKGNEFIKTNCSAKKVIATIWDWDAPSLKLHNKLGYKNIEWGELKGSRYDDGEAEEGKLLFEKKL